MERREQSSDDHDDDDLSEFDADVERRERPAQRARRQVHLAQNVRKSEAVNETEGKSDPRAHVAAALREQIVGSDINDA